MMKLFAISLCSALLPLTLASFVGPEVWRFPYVTTGASYVTRNPRDHLPDFSFYDDRGVFTPETIACPAALQQLTCSGHVTHKGEERCCTTAGNGTTHWCPGAMYCNSIMRYIHHQLNTSIPDFIGPAPKRKAVPRTRKNILERAIGWLAVHTPYQGCSTPRTKYSAIETCGTDDPKECPQYSHTASCEGMITMAFGVGERGAHEHRRFINCSEAKPGDAIRIIDKHGHPPHVMMFREWSNTSAQGFRVYQMGGGHNAANMAEHPGPHSFCDPNSKHKRSCLDCYRYTKVIEQEVEPIQLP